QKRRFFPLQSIERAVDIARRRIEAELRYRRDYFAVLAANGDFKFVELVHGSPLACRIKSFPIRLPRGESGSRTLCHCSSGRRDGAAFEPEVGSLRLPGSRESRYHFSQRTVPPTIRIIIPDHAHVYADTLLEKASAPWRRREGRLLVSRRGLERRVPMTLDDRRQCRVPPLRPSASGRRAARRSAGGKPGEGALHGPSLSDTPPHPAVFASVLLAAAVGRSAQAGRRDMRQPYGLETDRSASAVAP